MIAFNLYIKVSEFSDSKSYILSHARVYVEVPFHTALISHLLLPSSDRQFFPSYNCGFKEFLQSYIKYYL